MEARLKASDLVCNFYEIQSNEYDYGINWDMAKQCALIAVDEILESLSDIYIQGETDIDEVRIYYREVKQEIEVLK
jgi:hypothetical protein